MEITVGTVKRESYPKRELTPTLGSTNVITPYNAFWG